MRRSLYPYLTTDCDVSQTLVSLPVDVLRSVSVAAVTLEEPTCKGSKNGSHLILTIEGTSCGSISSLTDNGHPRLDNAVHLQVMYLMDSVNENPYSNYDPFYRKKIVNDFKSLKINVQKATFLSTCSSAWTPPCTG